MPGSKSSSKTAYLAAISAAVLFGFSTPLSKLMLGNIDSIPLAAFLYLGTGVGMGIILLIQRRIKGSFEKREAPIGRADLIWLLGAVGAGGIAAPIVLLWGLNATPAATASLLLNFEGVSTALIAALFFREAIGKRISLAIVLVTLASILLSWNSGGEWGFSVGALGILAACILWGMDNNFTRNIAAKNPLTIVGVKGIGAGIFSLLLSLILQKPMPEIQTALLAMLLGFVCYGVSIALFILGLRGLGAARTGILFGTAPFIGMSLSLWIFRDPVPTAFLIALPIMLLGTWLMMSEDHAHEHVHQPLAHEHVHTHPDEHHQHDHSSAAFNTGKHCHPHSHAGLAHRHNHTPDLHHRHEHAAG